MNRPLWSLRAFLWPALFLLAVFQWPLIFLIFSPKLLAISSIFGYFALGVLSAALYGLQHRWVWLFWWRVRGFATAENSHIVLHYENTIAAGETAAYILRSSPIELDNLARWFGFSLHRRVTVFLFSHCRDISTILGPRYGGCAIDKANAIVIARDNSVRESLKHELAHLFSARWNKSAVPLFQEGIAVCMQGTEWGQPIDAVALALMRAGGPRVPSLMQAKFFFAEPQRYACYELAGSFTGFLLRRYGWDRYRKLYRCCNAIRFAAKFKKCIGVSLEIAEWHWRNEVMVMDILNRRLGRMPHC